MTGGPGNDSLMSTRATTEAGLRVPPDSCEGVRQLFQAYLVDGGPGEDRVCDTFGPDLLNVRDGERDMAGCTNDFGAGRDVVIADRLTSSAATVASCAGRAAMERCRSGWKATMMNSLPGRPGMSISGCAADGPRVCAGELRMRRPQRPAATKSRGLFRTKFKN